MLIDKNIILDLLREGGTQEQVRQAEEELPDQIDTNRHADLLERFGLHVQELMQDFVGGDTAGQVEPPGSVEPS